jgi:alkanesulfonate monooxygenase SsuD/methylene tetrahydromethanopterin reductase-like flavin-dependent oxidoreductase (luciferase family)
MKYGIDIPNYGWFGDIDTIVEIAREAEDAGWDGLFLWDHMLLLKQEVAVLPILDPWIALAAIAINTRRIRLGPMVTPLPRRRPWKVAREAVTLDHLSKGRLILGVGLGAPPDVEFGGFGENPSARVRAEKMDEGLEIIRGLWSGEPFSHDGKHFHLEEMTFLPKPYQAGGIPLWVGGGYPFKAPFRRAAHFDGVVPVNSEWPEPLKPEYLRSVLQIVKSERGSLKDYDVVVAGATSGTDHAADLEVVKSWSRAGATWFLEDVHDLRAEMDVLRERIRSGPPKQT